MGTQALSHGGTQSHPATTSLWIARKLPKMLTKIIPKMNGRAATSTPSCWQNAAQMPMEGDKLISIKFCLLSFFCTKKALGFHVPTLAARCLSLFLTNRTFLNCLPSALPLLTATSASRMTKLRLAATENTKQPLKLTSSV